MTVLPENWLGNWKGQLTIAPPLPGRPPTVAMELRIAPRENGAVSWTILYESQPRDYELLPVAGTPDRFVLDEKNGIRMDAHRDGDTLHCVFEVDETLLVSRYTCEGRILRYEIQTYRRSETTRPTGGSNRITGFRQVGAQSARLHRVRLPGYNRNR